MKDESLRLKSKNKNKNRAGENITKGKDGINIYKNDQPKGKQTKLPLLSSKEEDIDSKRALNVDNTKNIKNIQNNENIYSNKINQVVQGSEIKNDENRDGNKEKNCCEKIGCIIF